MTEVIMLPKHLPEESSETLSPDGHDPCKVINLADWRIAQYQRNMGTTACDLPHWPNDNEPEDSPTRTEHAKALELVDRELCEFKEEGDDLMILNACFLALYAARERVAGTSKKIVRRRVMRHFAKVAEIIDCSGRGSDRQDSSILTEQATRPGSTLRELSSPSAP